MHTLFGIMLFMALIGYVNVHVFDIGLVAGVTSTPFEYYLNSGLITLFTLIFIGILIFFAYSILKGILWLILNPKKVYRTIIKCD